MNEERPKWNKGLTLNGLPVVFTDRLPGTFKGALVMVSLEELMRRQKILGVIFNVSWEGVALA